MTFPVACEPFYYCSEVWVEIGMHQGKFTGTWLEPTVVLENVTKCHLRSCGVHISSNGSRDGTKNSEVHLQPHQRPPPVSTSEQKNMFVFNYTLDTEDWTYQTKAIPDA
jgi:hypothetical protein